MGKGKAIYIDLTVFVLTMFATNALWKLFVPADDVGVWLSEHVARVVYMMIHPFNDQLHLINGYILHWEHGGTTSIVGSCSGIKQMVIWTAILLTSRPRRYNNNLWLHKLWFIPLGIIAAHCFNVLRILAITLIIHRHPELFTLVHEYLFKYLFYGMLFGLWLIWEYKFAKVL